MNRKFLAVFLTFCFGFIASSQAQLVDYERLKKYKSKKAAATNSTSSADNLKAQIFKQTYPVRQRIEKIYDLNGDKQLDTEEVKELLTDIARSIQRRGKLTIKSQILTPFDQNQDGQLDTNELTKIRSVLD